MSLEPGREGTAELTVAESDCAIAMKSGSLPVLATPRLVALMEEAACAALADLLEPGRTSVGVWIEMEHLAATPLGMRVTARARLEQVEGRTLHFTVQAADARETVARARHRRVLVEEARFMAKVDGKR